MKKDMYEFILTLIFIIIELGLSFRRKGWWKPFSDSLSSPSEEILDNSPNASDFDNDLQKSVKYVIQLQLT